MARLQAVLNLGVVDLKEERALRGLRIELLRDAVACAPARRVASSAARRQGSEAAGKRGGGEDRAARRWAAGGMAARGGS